jgi:hypothetical protein
MHAVLSGLLDWWIGVWMGQLANLVVVSGLLDWWIGVWMGQLANLVVVSGLLDWWIGVWMGQLANLVVVSGLLDWWIGVWMGQANLPFAEMTMVKSDPLNAIDTPSLEQPAAPVPHAHIASTQMFSPLSTSLMPLLLLPSPLFLISVIALVVALMSSVMTPSATNPCDALSAVGPGSLR